MGERLEVLEAGVRDEQFWRGPHVQDMDDVEVQVRGNREGQVGPSADEYIVYILDADAEAGYRRIATRLGREAAEHTIIVKMYSKAMRFVKKECFETDEVKGAINNLVELVLALNESEEMDRVGGDGEVGHALESGSTEFVFRDGTV